MSLFEKGYHENWGFFYAIYKRDEQEEQCIRFMEEGRYEELENLLQKLYEDKTWKEIWRTGNENPFQYVLEEAFMRKDQKAIEIVLKFVKIVSPLSYITGELLTDDAVLFRTLVKSRKMDWSPYYVMTLKHRKGKKVENLFSGNLMEILIFLHKPELVRILLEEGYTYRKSDDLRDRTLGDTEQFSEDYSFWNPLELAIHVCDKEITEIFMEQGKYDFALKEKPIRRTTKKHKAFFMWLMEKYPKRVMEKINLAWILTECGAYSYKRKLLEVYKETRELEALLKELEEIFLMACDPDWGLLEDDGFTIISIMDTIRKLKRMAKTKEEKKKICQTEEKVFERLGGTWNSIVQDYPVIFFIVADYWYRREKVLHPETVGGLLFFYFYWDKNEWKNTEDDILQSCLTNKEAKSFYQKAIKIMDSLVEKADIQPFTPYISLKFIEEKVDKKKICVVMDKLDPKRNGTIEKKDKASFLAFLLLQDSPMLVKKAWKKKFLTGGNLPEAIRFAANEEKKRILPYLYECVGNSNIEIESEEYLL